MTPPVMVRRQTRETDIRVTLAVGTGRSRVETPVPFLDHMLTTLARYSGVDIDLSASGDLKHHVIEDVAIAVGTAWNALVPDGAARFAQRTIPMDDALVDAVIDIGGRPFYRGPLPSSLYEHWMRSFCDAAKFTLHLRVLRGSDRHHIVESAFKAVGLALRDAMRDTGEVFSTKGAVRLEQP